MPTPFTFEEAQTDGSFTFEELNPAGQLEGVINSYQRGNLAAQRALTAAQMPEGAPRLTMRQLRTSHVKAMEDPAYMESLMAAGDDPAKLAKAESMFGPARHEGALLDQQAQTRVAIAHDIAKLTKEIEAIPRSAAMQEWDKADNKNWAGTFAKNPIEITANIFAESLPQASMGMGAAALGGAAARVGQSVGASVGSFTMEAANSFLDGAIQTGTDLTDPDQVRKFFADPDKVAKAHDFAVKRGVPISLIDGLTAGIAGRFLKPMLGKGAGKVALGTAAELGAQMTGGAAGEATAQLVTGQPFSWKDIAAEAIGELATAPGEVVGNLRREGQGTPASAAAAPAPVPLTFNDPQPKLVDPAEAELQAALAAFAPAPQPASAPAAPVPMSPLPEVITPEQRMARENVDAMAALRAAKAAPSAPPNETIPPQPLIAPPAVQESLIEGPREQSPPATITGSNARQGAEMPAEMGAGTVGSPIPIPEAPVRPSAPPDAGRMDAAPPARKGRFTLGQRPDGVPDILDHIQELGGIKAPGSAKGTAEYDGYAAAFNEGGPASVLRGGANRPDLLLQQLQGLGLNFETIDDMYGAVIRASDARAALAADLKAARTVRPDRIEKVERLYNAAMAGTFPTLDQLAQIESGLNEKELRTLKGPLLKLRTLADVAVPTAGEPSPVAQAKAGVRAAWNDLQTLGIMPDPQRDAEKVFALYKALFKLAVAAAKAGVKSAAEFAERVGLKLNAVVQAAWDDALAGSPKSGPLAFDPAAIAELTEGFRERKFSTRFEDDERMDPVLRARTGNATYQAIPNELTVTQALGFIQEQGIDAAIARMKDERNRDISDRERVTVGQAIITKLNHAYAQTQDETALDKAVDVAEWLTEYGTRLGQGVQAFAIWNRLTPEGYVRAYVKAAGEAARRKAGRPKPGAPPFRPPPVDASIKKDIQRRANDALRKPAGFQRDEAIVDVLATIARAKGVSKMDVALALWYANILSGWTTQVRNLSGNVSNVLAETAAHAAVRPQHLPAMLAGLYNGVLRGAFESRAILRTGKVTGTRVGKVEAPTALELTKFKGLAAPLNAWKYVFRAMAATDMVFFRGAEEMRARFTAREVARTEKLSGNAFARRVADLLHDTPALRAQAQAQATREGLTGGAHSRRVAEIIEPGRPADLVQGAADYGRFATFNQDPEGVMGVLSSGIAGMSQRFPPLRLVVPFTRVVANVTNNGLNFSPWGYRRLFPSAFLEDNWMKPDATPLDYQLQAARATLGTLGLTALYALAIGYRDMEDPPFMLTANGPQSPEARKQLRETGWEPYTVKIGDRYWSYRETPLHLVMATLGNLLDAGRYKKLDEADAFTRYAYALRQIGSAPLNQSFLRSLGEFFEGLQEDRVPRSGAKFGGLSRTASSLVVPNLVKQIDRLFDPTVYDAGTVQGALLRDIPVARSGLAPAINVLGEPIRADQNPFYSLERPDPLWQLLGRRQLWISTPSRTMIVGDRPITPDEYRTFTGERGRWLGKELRAPDIMDFLRTLPAEEAGKMLDTFERAATDHARAKLDLAPAGARGQ